MYERQEQRHNLFTMALLYIIIALVLQGSFTYANVTDSEEFVDHVEYLKNETEVEDELIKDFHSGQKDWIDFFLLPDTQLFPTSSVAMMTQATKSNKTAEEQLEEIQEIAQKITLAIQSEMANLLSYALNSCDKEEEEVDNNLRKKRSTETPMASTQLITRLLKHIKSNNEYQNSAIDKMMTAQEIADKYGIEFSPDTEILSDLAFAANEHAKDMNNLLKDSIEMKNVSQKVEYVPVETPSMKEDQDNDSYYVYAVPKDQSLPQNHQHHAQPSMNHQHYQDSYPGYSYYYNYPYETQIPAPMQNQYSAPVSKRPNFYDAVSYTPQDYSPYCSMEPIITSSTIVFPIEELVEPEPELVGEEFEETVSSKVYVERGDEPGSATVNHVMTYTVAEKSHFKTPEIERLPQHMQYSFFLM